MASEQFIDALASFEASQESLNAAVKAEVRRALSEAFEDPAVQNVTFGISTAEYNDENAGRGTFGPCVNLIEADSEWDYEQHEYPLLYDRRKDDGAESLAEVIESVGYERLATAFRLNPGADAYSGTDTNAYVATRTESGFDFHVEDLRH